MLALHILTPELTLLGEIADCKSLRLQRRFHEVGDFEMTLPLAHPMQERLARDLILCPVGAPQKAMLIEEITRDEGTDSVSVRGYTLSGLLRRRICVPPDGGSGSFGYDRIISDAESVMRHYVENNVIAPESSARVMDCVALEAENGHRGRESVAWSARFEQLDELLAAVGAYCDAGYALVPDFARGRLVFTYLPGRDRTGADGSCVIFGVHMGNVSGTTSAQSAKQMRNAAIVGGAGEDENRLFLSVCPGGESGLARRELFVDAGSRDDPQELEQEGAHRLAEKGLSETIRASVIDTPSCRYGVHWDLGDLVTVVAQDAQMRARITQVQESHEAGHAPALEVVFGELAGGIERIVKERTRLAVR